ncbi:U1 small nuclear ribonucleo protein A [Coccomyxa subellipsoidea C-169]|uniref:U1 small nuclear ribonucleo protein A n=1 Tax=Coccomyxa subellipsoidea (strain C-169) TaxID=574566 RepID=I0Z1L4_COCSC|nr:U1 small nuclear ribonucleo protein A [Coccomyxa subellipsoidea C-169]EIE24533.1 U1 small nuclear ribonucleo protein A [Coccomyxa subellipsoidea C-169]|eukprot:XP_005649077.1 U1 small nuclear ribonucleo protein A [Coccomyxa subellipsoidea C-169]
MADIAPNQTIYVNNLPEKIKKEDLKKSIYAIFSQFGKILDVVALKTYRLRGQAWVVFADQKSADDAIRSMQGFPFFEKPIRLSYAKGESDAVAKLHNRFEEKDKKERQKHNKLERVKGRHREHRLQQQPLWCASIILAAPIAPGNAPPHKILFVQNLPEETTSAMLALLFQQYAGYIETRMVEARPGIAFVEFEDEDKATVAMAGLQGFKITATNAFTISYANR